MEQQRRGVPAARRRRRGRALHRRGPSPRSGFLRCDGEPRPPLPQDEAPWGDGPVCGSCAPVPRSTVALAREGDRARRPPRVYPRDEGVRACTHPGSEVEGGPSRIAEGEDPPRDDGLLPRGLRMLRNAPRGGSGLRRMRDSGSLPGSDDVSLPSLAEVEHSDWPALQRMCETLGLNPKGRSAVVRMRVGGYVRHRVHPPSWRPAREHQAALLTRLGHPDLAERVWESTIQLEAPAPWVGLGHAQLAGGFL